MESKTFLMVIFLFIQLFALQRFPTVGVLMKPMQEEYPQLNLTNATNVVEQTYVYFLEQSGARVIPIDYRLNESEIEHLMDLTDCALFPGGGSNLTYDDSGNQKFTQLFKTGQLILNKSINLFNSQKPESYPIWGTCLGHELILMSLANDTQYLQNCHNCDIYNAVLNFSSDLSRSNIFSNFPLIDLEKLKNVPLTINGHLYSINKTQFYNSKFPQVSEYLQIIAESPSKDNSDFFISNTEGKNNLSIFTSQYHPEIWNYRYSSYFPHCSFCSHLSFEYSSFFISKCRDRMKEKNRSNDDYFQTNTIFKKNIFYSQSTGQLFYY